MKKKGFTLIELLVVIAIIAMLLAILMPALNKVKKIAQRVICGTNLKGLGTAQTVYANDYEDEYAVQGRGLSHTWNVGTKAAPSNVATTGWQNLTTNITNTVGNVTIGASLYLLVREADVAPKSFVCPSSNETEFSGRNTGGPGGQALDITELFDFGSPLFVPVGGSAEGPVKCVSYSYQMPYGAGQINPAPVSTGSKGKYAADARRSAAFAIMSDKNPYFEPKLTNGGPSSSDWLGRVTLLGAANVPTDWVNIEKWRINVANGPVHDREGQNVLFADGHNSYETRTDVGIRNDNIFTQWSATDEAGRRRGTFLQTPASQAAPQQTEDSVLVNDL